jgi:hypothetical protein
VDRGHAQRLDRLGKHAHNGSRDQAAWELPIGSSGDTPGISASGHLIELVGEALQPGQNFRVQVASDQPDWLVFGEGQQGRAKLPKARGIGVGRFACFCGLSPVSW